MLCCALSGPPVPAPLSLHDALPSSLGTPAFSDLDGSIQHRVQTQVVKDPRDVSGSVGRTVLESVIDGDGPGTKTRPRCFEGKRTGQRQRIGPTTTGDQDRGPGGQGPQHRPDGQAYGGQGGW